MRPIPTTSITASPAWAPKMDVRDGYPHMDDYASIEELKYTVAGSNPTLAAKQYGELTMAYEDCDTIPFLWNYANRFNAFRQLFPSTRSGRPRRMRST